MSLKDQITDDMKAAMRAKSRLAGKADMAQVSAAVKASLAG